MHVVMFGDQHVESLGGAQVSMRLQRRFLEKAGHTVTIVAPAMHGARAACGARRTARRTSTCRRSRSRSTGSTRSPGRAGAPIDGWMPRWRPPAGRCRARPGGLLGRLHRSPLRRPARAAGRPHDAQPGRRGDRGDGALPGSRAAGAQRVAAAGARLRGRGSGRLVVSAAVRRAIGCRHRPVVALRATARSARRRARRAARRPRRRPARRRHLERHRRRGAGRGARSQAQRPEPRARPGRRGSCGSDA